MMREAARVRRERCTPGEGHWWWGWGLSLALCVGGGAACGPMEPGSPWEEEIATEKQAAKVINGLSVNGLSVNGLSVNGLSVNGLNTTAFRQWFNQDPAQNDAVMDYVARCAMPQGAVLSYVNPQTGVSYRWEGSLGLAPDWSNGALPSQREQQVVSACLAAHINKFGVHVPISVLGNTAKGVPLPYKKQELKKFSMKEACFFGNFFDSQGGVFAANDRPLLSEQESTSRACGLASSNQREDCAPVSHVGFCEDFCTLDSTGTYYTQCTYAGRSFIPMTTRIKPEEIYECGDGVCQFTEKCGTGNTAKSCAVDCGLCAKGHR